jgi:hypothetical protein
MHRDERTDEATADEWKLAWTDDIDYFELLRWFRDLIDLCKRSDFSRF